MKKSMFAALCLSSILALGTVTSCSDNESAPSYFIDPNETPTLKIWKYSSAIMRVHNNGK